MQANDTLLVLTTCDDPAVAERLARQLVEKRFAACVNTVGGVTSTYRWNDNVEQASEYLLLIKTTGARYEALELAIRQLSGYELPEVIAVPIEAGSDAYLEWVRLNSNDKMADTVK